MGPSISFAPLALCALVALTAACKDFSTRYGLARCEAGCVRINEIASRSPRNTRDWIELYNPGSAAVDLSGWQITDNAGEDSYVVPAGTRIAPGAFFIACGAPNASANDPEDARRCAATDLPTSVSFQFGAVDAAVLFDAKEDVVDAWSWSDHAVTTWGRCGDGTGAFVATIAGTSGARNDCPIRLNEVASGDEATGWVELYNAGPEAVDLSRYQLRDGDDSHAGYTLAQGTSLASGAYKVLDPAQLGFTLDESDTIRLFEAHGSPVDSYQWTRPAPVTWARCPNGTGAFVASVFARKGSANACGLRINEVKRSDGGGSWVELINASSAPLDLSGYRILDEEPMNNPKHIYVFPAGILIGAGHYLVIDEAELTFPVLANYAVYLTDPFDNPLDEFFWSPPSSATYSRCPDASGEFVDSAEATPGALNLCPR